MESNKARYSSLLKPTLLWFAWFLVHITSSQLLVFTSVPLRYGYRYTDTGIDFGLPEWIGVHANFDGVHYITIAREGYGLLQQAFFPLYPTLLRYTSAFFSQNTLLAGWVLSIIFSICAVLVWYTIFNNLTQNTKRAFWSVIAMLLFPGAFFLLALYTESLFILLFGLYVWGLLRKKWWLMGFAGLLLGLSRLVGSLVIFIPLTTVILTHLHTRTVNIRQIVAGITPLVGLAMFVVYSGVNFGDHFAFFHIQEQFNNGRSTDIILLPQVVWRYFNIFLKARVDIVYFVAVVEFLVFTVVFCLLMWGLSREWKQAKMLQKNDERAAIMVGLILFSIGNLLLPTFTGTFSSIPRYALVGMAVYPIFSVLPRPARLIFLVLSFTLQTVLFVFFSQGWFVS